VAKVYLKRMLRWRRTSSPFLSGDAFANLADVVVYAPRFWRKEPSWGEIRNAKVIFCRSDLLQTFLTENSGKIFPRVIIAGNSDYEFRLPLNHIPSSTSTILLQNSFISDNEKIFTIPIGIENFRFGVNGHPRLFRFDSKLKKNNKVLIGPFSDTHSDRRKVLDLFTNEYGPWDVVTSRLSPKKLAKVSSCYGFVAAVRGNGVDTHRLWETLYRGSIPIVEENAWSQSIKEFGFPVTLVEKITPEVLRAQRWMDEVIPLLQPELISMLWMPFWEDFVAVKSMPREGSLYE